MIPHILLLLLLQQPATAPAKPEIKGFDDIEIGMVGDSISQALTQHGYTVSGPQKPITSARKVELNGKLVGTYWVNDDGRVYHAEKRIYTAAGKREDVIEFAEALYWLIRDEGIVRRTDDKDTVQTKAEVELITEDTASRIPGVSTKKVYIKTKSGSEYLISIYRLSPDVAWPIDIVQFAPFPKR